MLTSPVTQETFWRKRATSVATCISNLNTSDRFRAHVKTHQPTGVSAGSQWGLPEELGMSHLATRAPPGDPPAR